MSSLFFEVSLRLLRGYLEYLVYSLHWRLGMVFAKGGLVQDLHLQKFSEAVEKKSQSVQIKSTRGYCIFEYLNTVYGSD